MMAQFPAEERRSGTEKMKIKLNWEAKKMTGWGSEEQI
jgi:hypothetical protein